jgi:UDP-N-acetylmuramoylalanine--D-glutamate ligase
LIELIKGKEVLVVGMARSGVAAVELLAEIGAAKITVTDQKQPGELEAELARVAHYSTVTAVTGRNPSELVTTALSLVIKSPGVPPSLEMFTRARELKIPVLSEIELAYAFIKAPLVGVTGTNGKTTTTALITEILKEARFNPVVSAGNIGNPLSGLVGKIGSQGFIVAELSSFQLEDIDTFRPAVAVFLNFAEDHIDYHGSVELYYRAKARILENQTENDYAVLNAGDPAVASLQDKVRGQLLWFNRAPVPLGVGLEKEMVMFYKPGYKPSLICPRSEIALPGEHNLENALAASAAAWAAGADLQSIGSVLRSFRAIEHRLEHVVTLSDVDFINDSKGTNPGATIKALQSFAGKEIILIAGGKDRGSDFSELAAVIKQEVRSLLLIGETSAKIARAVEAIGFKNYQELKTLDEAVFAAWAEVRPGEVVLLSPACASWDMFTNYEVRGNIFKELVHTLQDQAPKKGGGNDE